MTPPLALPRPVTVGAALSSAALIAGVAAFPSAALAQEEWDLYAENAWAIDQVNAEDVWATTKGEGMTVAVVDTGIAEEHPFLEDKNILDGESFVLSEEDSARFDTDGHGTGVSAAVLYAAPEATVLPVRVYPTTADIGFSTGAGQNRFDGIRWAADNGANVMVIPWIEVMAGEDREPAPEFLEAVQYAIDKDIVVIAGGGNDPELDQVPNPASFPGVIAVSGTDKDGNAWSMNTTGPEIVLAGPADTMIFPIPQIVSFGEEDLYFQAAGTSAASGIVGGAAALVRAAHPDLDASNVIQRLITTADDGGQGRTEELGFGLVDAAAAVTATDVETVAENPLGYPMGEAGASGASPDEEPGSEASEEVVSTSDAAADNAADSGSGLTPIMAVAVALLLVAAAVVVWLVLRSRSRSKARVQPWQ
ncbi:S8 family serine peptidase [Glycomyces niveus]|uniref:S8 family serine peptidase n=1 Tax=Glycomyces niveus TaxID=2820287 RepID=A0ABS3U2X2_9ACTN|nr:S8 family serine peptidase [Glycomyces sp. NEAU-S30]MBO3733122.1 S8 family serine peptidase [Glycomyces sp. NEAU-S30]